MKRSRLILSYIVIFLFAHVSHCMSHDPSLRIDRVVLWGCKHFSDTFAYVNFAFAKAFKHLGYEVLWLDNNDRIDHINLAHSLILGVGHVDQNIPLRDDCYYVLHNCDLTKYDSLYKANKCLVLQVYVNDILTRDVEYIADCVYYQPSLKTLYQPWATDLLPHEIDSIKLQLTTKKNKESVVYWVGTIWDGLFGNRDKLSRFESACNKAGVRFEHLANIRLEQNINFMQKSFLAPAIQGQWQCEKGYIPCRIFKNISYGALGITNSETVYNLFKRKIVYNPDTYQLFFDAFERAKTITLEEQYELMDFVKEHHTYLNRIERIFQFLARLQQTTH